MDISLVHPSTTAHHLHPILTVHHLRPILTFKPRVSPPIKHSSKPRLTTITAAAAPSGGSSGRGGDMKEQTWTHEGLITESLSNGMFKVGLENGDVILGHVSGKMRQSRIKVLPGDRVKIEVSRYDSSRGRITYRLRATDTSNTAKGGTP